MPEELSYPQTDLDQKVLVSTNTPALISHAPFSLLHVTEEPEENSKKILWTETEKDYFIPETKEVFGEDLNKENLQMINLVEQQKDIDLKNFYLTNINRDKTLFGEFQPITYKKGTKEIINKETHKGESLDPVKYISNVMLQEYLKTPKNKQVSLVMHPDVLYFGAQGDKNKLPKILNFVNQMANTLNQKVFIENLSFKKEKYIQSLPMFINPLSLYNLLEKYNALGIVLDIEHAKKMNIQDKELDNIFELINPKRIIIHARKGMKEEYPHYYKYAFIKGIPWIIENE